MVSGYCDVNNDGHLNQILCRAIEGARAHQELYFISLRIAIISRRNSPPTSLVICQQQYNDDYFTMTTTG